MFTTSRTTFTGIAAAAAVAAVCGTGAATARADSIVYADGGNIWSARPDGSGKVQLTTGGGWHSPTQSDDGTIAAVQGTGPIRVMARDGRPLRTITTPSARSGDGGTFAPRPVELSFSPDGSKIAYAYVANSCPPASTCGSVQRSTFYTASTVAEATPIATYGNQFSVSDPEWITNDRALVFGGAGSQVSIDDLGPGDYNYVRWMTPNADQGDGELSRDGTRLVTTFFYGDEKLIAWFAVSGDPRTQSPPPQPKVACNTAAGNAAAADPTFSPDGTGTAWQTKDGIEVVRFTEFGPNHCATRPNTILTATGSEPDWGPADPPAARYDQAAPAPAPSGTPEVRPAPVASSSTVPVPPPSLEAAAAITISAPRTRLAAAARSGVRIPVTVPAAGPVRLQLRFRGAVIGTARMTARRAGERTVTVRLSKAGRAALRRGRTVRLVVTVTQGEATATRTVTLHR